jgi:hypothetical protein
MHRMGCLLGGILSFCFGVSTAWAQEKILVHVLGKGVQTTLGFDDQTLLFREDRDLNSGRAVAPLVNPLDDPRRVIWLVAEGRKTRISYSDAVEQSRRTWDTSTGRVLPPDLHLTLPKVLAEGGAWLARGAYMSAPPQESSNVSGEEDLFGGDPYPSPGGGGDGFVGEVMAAEDLFGEDLGGLLPGRSEKPRGLEVHGTVETLVMFGEDGPSPHVLETGLSGNRAIEARSGILHLDASLGNDVKYFGQVRFVRFNKVDMRVNMLQLGDPGRTHWIVGRTITPFGTFPVRNLPELNSMYGYPLGYSYRTSLRTDQAPTSTAGILANRGTGGGGSGMALGGPAWYSTYALYNTPLGSSGKGKLTLGLSNGAQSNSENVTSNDAFGFIAHLSVDPHPSWKLGASASIAPYMTRSATGFAAGEEPEDFDQKLFGMDVEYSRDRWRLMGEVLLNSWEVSQNAGVAGNELDSTSWYLEANYAATPKVYFTGRYSAIDFDRIADGAGGTTPWDYDVNRLELGIGFRPMVNVLAKLSGQKNKTKGIQDPDDDILVAQLVGTF